MSGILKTMLSFVVYAPLILISIYIIYSIGYGIYHFRTYGRLPPSYEIGFSIIKRIILTLLIPVKLLGQFLWWVFPFFPSYRSRLGYIYMGAWDTLNIGRTFLLLANILFISMYVLAMNYGYPVFLVKYANTVNYLLILSISVLLLASLIQFYRETSADFPVAGSFNEKSRWLFSSTGNYLYYIIGVGLAIGLLFAFGYYITKYNIGSIFGLTVTTLLSLIVAMFVIYGMLTQNSSFTNILRNYPILKVPFYLLFIIPCVFFDTVTFLFNHLRHTPKVVYYILAAEIVLVSLYIIIPIINNWLYTTTLTKSNKKVVLQNKINAASDQNETIKERIKKIKNSAPKDSAIIDEAGWRNIISNDLNNPDNIEELKMFLMNYGYLTSELCEGDDRYANKEECVEKMNFMINLIQKDTTELITLMSKLKENEEYIKNLKEEKTKASNTEKGTVLLRDPVFLNNKRILGGFQELQMQNYTIDYKYNYSISAWFFLHAQPPNYKASYNKFTSILNYNDKPNILYNAKKNIILIKMNNGLYKKPIMYKIKKFPLQKWNNIVINYDSGTFDIFINSKLVASFPNTVPYMSIDEITIGSDKGVPGGVCNVVYFPISISYERIKINYELLKNKNPPVI